jgi:protein gp37
MNRTKIEWCDYSWNPVTGCLHGCWYCYARKLFTRFHKPFTPLFYPERLKEPWQLKKPSKIFVCSVSDLFAPWTPTEWRDAVLQSIFECPVKHTFQLLTKNPERIPPIHFPDNVWVGATVTNEGADYRNIAYMNFVQAKIRFISFEPLLGSLPAAVTLKEMQWIIIGKLTGSRKVELKEAWVEDIVEEAKRYGIPVFMKNNLCPPFEKSELIQEFPK